MLYKKNLRKYLLLVMLVSLSLLISGCSGVKAGQEAPDFTLKDLNGNNITLSDLRGKNIYLNFWASWCDPCKDEMPDIEKIYNDYKDKDFLILAVNTDEPEETVKSFIETSGYTFSVLLDTNLDVARLYNTSNIPVSFFINKDGKVVSKSEGLMSAEDIKEAVEEFYQ